jgi:hypothetical protein
MAKRKPKKADLPILQAIVPCDTIAPHGGDLNKLTLYGTFDKFGMQTVPGNVMFCVYVCLFGGKGVHPVEIRFLNAKNRPVMDPMVFKGLKFKPKERVQLNGRLLIEIKELGKLQLLVFVEGVQLGEPLILRVEKAAASNATN